MTSSGVSTALLFTVLTIAPQRGFAQTPRSTANQGLAAHNGWQDPDGSPDGLNSIALNAVDNQTIAWSGP